MDTACTTQPQQHCTDPPDTLPPWASWTQLHTRSPGSTGPSTQSWSSLLQHRTSLLDTQHTTPHHLRCTARLHTALQWRWWTREGRHTREHIHHHRHQWSDPTTRRTPHLDTACTTQTPAHSIGQLHTALQWRWWTQPNTRTPRCSSSTPPPRSDSTCPPDTPHMRQNLQGCTSRQHTPLPSHWTTQPDTRTPHYRFPHTQRRTSDPLWS